MSPILRSVAFLAPASPEELMAAAGIDADAIVAAVTTLVVAPAEVAV